MPIGDKGFAGYIAVTHPAEMFIEMLKRRLALKNIVVTGKAVGNATAFDLAELRSPPFSILAEKTMKPSQNMFTETILWILGEETRVREYPPPPDHVRPESSQAGLAAVRDFLKQAGISRDAVLQYDGSGMSRHDQVTPAAVVQLYTYMAKQSKNAQVWRNSLAVGGSDGTLSRRFSGTAAAGNVRGKTGTLDQVSALSGYVTTAGGEELVVSILVNGVVETRTRTSLIDDIVVQLANFDGRIN